MGCIDVNKLVLEIFVLRSALVAKRHYKTLLQGFALCIDRWQLVHGKVLLTSILISSSSASDVAGVENTCLVQSLDLIVHIVPVIHFDFALFSVKSNLNIII